MFVLAFGFAVFWSAVIVKAEVAPAFRAWSPCRECAERRREYRREHRRHHHHARRARKVWREERHEPEDRWRHRCWPSIKVVGDQYASEDGARKEADKAWMQTSRWKHGERFMARENARDATYECGRSSVGSVVGQVFYRCELEARPCAPEKVHGGN